MFRCPAQLMVGPLAIIGCLYLLVSLPAHTLERFLVWNAIGLLAYVLYARHNSLLARGA